MTAHNRTALVGKQVALMVPVPILALFLGVVPRVDLDLRLGNGIPYGARAIAPSLL